MAVEHALEVLGLKPTLGVPGLMKSKLGVLALTTHTLGVPGMLKPTLGFLDLRLWKPQTPIVLGLWKSPAI